MDYLITEAVAFKAAREERDAQKKHEKEEERKRFKEEQKEKLKQQFG